VANELELAKWRKSGMTAAPTAYLRHAEVRVITHLYSTFIRGLSVLLKIHDSESYEADTIPNAVVDALPNTIQPRSHAAGILQSLAPVTHSVSGMQSNITVLVHLRSRPQHCLALPCML